MTLGMIPATAARCMISSSGRRNAWKPISATNGSLSAKRRPNGDQARASVITTIDANQITIGGGRSSKRPSQPDSAAAACAASQIATPAPARIVRRRRAAGVQPVAGQPGGGDEQGAQRQRDGGDSDADEGGIHEPDGTLIYNSVNLKI